MAAAFGCLADLVCGFVGGVPGRLGIWMPAMLFAEGLDRDELKLVRDVNGRWRPHDTAEEVQERPRVVRICAADGSVSGVDKS